MFSKINFKRFNEDNALRRRILIISFVSTFVYLFPFNGYHLFERMGYEARVEWENLQLKMAKVEIAVRQYPTINDIPPKFFNDIAKPGDEVVLTQEGKTLKYETPEEVLEILPITELISSLVVTLLRYIGKDEIYEIESNYNANLFFEDNMLHATYKTIYFDPVTNKEVEIVIVRDLSPVFYKLVDRFLKLLPVNLIVILTISIIATMIGLRLVFSPLKKAAVEGFEEVKASNYKKRMTVETRYGKEIADTISNFNAVLDHLQDIVDSNVQSMQDSSHEVNTQLTSIKQSVDMIQMYGKGDPNMVLNKLESIGHSVIRTKRIMSTVLELARLNQGNLQSAEDYFLFDLLDEFIEHQRRTHSSFRFNLSYQSEDSSICINREHFYLALNPLIENAVRYSFADHHDIDVEVYEDGVLSHISITNYGDEIDQNELPHIFERHFRGSNYKHKAGSGLGLHIVKEVVNLYNGYVRVKSENGKTTFTIAFPAKCPNS